MNTPLALSSAFRSVFTLSTLPKDKRLEAEKLLDAFEKMRAGSHEFKEILESWIEKGSISPDLMSLYEIADFIVNYDPRTQIAKDRYLDTSVDDLEFTTRTLACLKDQGILFVGDLVVKTDVDLLKIPNLGRRCLNEIKEVLAIRGLCLSMKVGEWKPKAKG